METALSSGPVGRMTAPVLQMAALAGAGVIEGAETVGGVRGGWCDHPEAFEEAVADEEIGALLEA